MAAGFGVPVCYHDKSNRNQSHGCGDNAIFRFKDGGHPSSWICWTGIFGVLDHPQRVLGGFIIVQFFANDAVVWII